MKENNINEELDMLKRIEMLIAEIDERLGE